MFLKQGNYQWIYVCQETLHFRICKKKGKSQFAVFYLAPEALTCRLLLKLKNELKIYIMYICVFGIAISITHVGILMEELCSELNLDFKVRFSPSKKLLFVSMIALQKWWKMLLFFTPKTLFVLKIFEYLFWLLRHVEKRLD